MSDDKSLHTSPQLAFEGAAVALSAKQIGSLYKKSKNSGFSFDTLEEVYWRGYNSWHPLNEETAEQIGFNRVNSFIAGGAAADIDSDLLEEKKGLWANIHAKRERIKKGSGERMRKPGSKGAPTPEQMKRAMGEQYTGAEKVSKNADDPSSRFIGTTSLTDVYKSMTPGYSRLKTIKKVVKEQLEGCPIDEEEIHELIEEEFLVSGEELYEDWGELEEEAEKGGRKVKLGKPFLTPGGPKKRAVYVKNEKGNVVKVNFGDPNMSIKKSDPARRRSFRARHNCANPGPRTKARYWSCKAW